MAKQIQTIFIDDIDGGAADGTVPFALDGVNYEIDLSGANREKLEKILAPYITKARPVRSERRGKRVTLTRGGPDRAYTKRIREWAKREGLQVSERGRIASGIVEQYEASH
ncbi:histone-like nucleoid-structuring protein Lsr2 [Nonomuraea soli]|uniref:Lsr2 family protein n=1 Tax=Nonomuraea soli TaxID=1032476 RepID=A0A7W0CV08_9ACTN|nr:Lsr2 family protein [Nonomuraea soli]MBA2897678.1 hypothetical protein [Nonomuraea soli]